MTRVEIQRKLSGVLQQVFDDPSLVFEDTTTANDVAGWDSVTHVSVIVAVEKAFAVRFSTKEVKSLANVGDFIRLIERRTQ
jgi:acyl carrier protein